MAGPRERRQEYMRQYAEKNREKIRAQRKAKYEANREEILAKNARWYAENSDTYLQKQREYNAKNAERRRETERARRSDPANKAKVREYCRKRVYGLTPEALRTLLESQGYRCPICGEPVGERDHVDHCHETGVVRGVLHGRCNSGIGHLGDSVARLRAAIAYLERTTPSGEKP